MSDKARELLKEAIREYREEDGANEVGSYTDLVIDLFHMMVKDKDFLNGLTNAPLTFKDWDDDDIDAVVQPYIQDMVFDSAFFGFKEELEIEEHEKIRAIPKKDLPLYLQNKWLFESSKEILECRLREEE